VSPIEELAEELDTLPADTHITPQVQHSYSADSPPPQDMATSMGESFWKRFQEREHTQQAAVAAVECVDAVGIPNDELDDLLPPTSFSCLPQGSSRNSTGNRKTEITGARSAVQIKPAPVTMSSRPAARSTLSSGGGYENKASEAMLTIVGTRHARLDTANNRLDPATAPSHVTSSSSSSDAVSAGARLSSQCHELVDSLLGSSIRLGADLSTRLVSLRMLRQLWNQGQVLDVIEHLQGLNDAMQLNLLADFFNAVELRGSGLMSLDGCFKMLPILQSMLAPCGQQQQGQATVIFAVYKSLSSLLEAFGELIRNTRSVIVAGGVDLSREARLNKCNACHTIFAQARTRLETLRHQFRQQPGVYELLDSYQKLCHTYLH
jgi:hypothetical protein